MFQLIVLLKPNSIVVIVLHYLELIKLQLEHKVLYQLSQMLLLDLQQYWSYLTYFSDQVRLRLISQLIKGISRVLQKLLRYFNSSLISTCFVLSLPAWSVVFCLYLNDLLLWLTKVKSIILSLLSKHGPSQTYSHELWDF